FLTPDLLPIFLEDLLGLVAQHRDLLLREALWEEEPALVLELLQLLGGELHGRILQLGACVVAPARIAANTRAGISSKLTFVIVQADFRNCDSACWHSAVHVASGVSASTNPE